MNSPAAQLFTDDGVYLGTWINWSHGRIRGATLTLSRRDGGLLTAFLALFVGAVGTSFWRIGCFLIHRYFFSKHAADALYHQRQAILRNASNSQSGLVALLRTCWAWRRNSFAIYSRLFPSIFFAILTLFGFIIAGIFSSAVATSMGQEILLKSPNCGFSITGIDQNSSTNMEILTSYLSKRILSSLSYSHRCYLDDANLRDCATFIQPRLQWTIDRNTTCPFPGNEDICLNNFGNLRIDSGYINSHYHLGINSPPEARILYRRVVECAPVQTRGYTRNFTPAPANESYVQKTKDDGEPLTWNDVTQYFYGRRKKSAGNFTYQYSQASLYKLAGVPENAFTDYTLRSV